MTQGSAKSTARDSSYAQTRGELAGMRAQITEIRDRMRKLQRAITPQPVTDYRFSTVDGERTLASLFGDKNDLVVIHNMGKSCSYCTLWADGYNGLYPHLANRAAFVLTSPDAPEVQQAFAASRGWRFPMVSHQGTSFAADMGYKTPNGGWNPGVSAFQRNGKSIVRVSDTVLGPYDDFCAAWHLFDLFPEGSNNWAPKFQYPT